jgi:hypothetical protein
MPEDDLEQNGQQEERAPEALREERENREQVMLRELVERAIENIVKLKERLDAQTSLSAAERESQLVSAVNEIGIRLDELARLAQDQREEEQRAVVEELGVLGAFIRPPDITVQPELHSQRLRAELTTGLSISPSTIPAGLGKAVMMLAPTPAELTQALRRSSDQELLQTSDWILQHPTTENLLVLMEVKKLYIHEAASLLLTRDLNDTQLKKIIVAPIVDELRDQAIEQLDQTNTAEIAQLILERGSRSRAESKATELLDAGPVPNEQLLIMLNRLPGLRDRAATELLKDNSLSAEQLRMIAYRSNASREAAIDRLMAQASPSVHDLIAAAHSSRAAIKTQAWDKAKVLATSVETMLPILASWPDNQAEVWQHFLSLNPNAEQLGQASSYPLPQAQKDRLIAHILSHAASQTPSLLALTNIVNNGTNEQALQAANLILTQLSSISSFGMSEEISAAMIMRIPNPELQMRTLQFLLQQHPDHALISMSLVLSRGNDAMKKLVKDHLVAKTNKSTHEWGILLSLDQTSETHLFRNPSQIDASLFPYLSEAKQRELLQARQADPVFIRKIIPYVEIGWIRQAASFDAIWTQLQASLGSYRDALILRGYQLNRFVPDVMTGGLTVNRFEFDTVMKSTAFKHYLSETAPEDMNIGQSFSIIKAVIHRLHGQAVEIDETHIATALESIHTARQRHRTAILMDADTKLILATHRERRFDNEDIINMFERAGLSRANILASVKGIELNAQGQNTQKITLLDAIKNAKSGRHTVVFSGHGTREALWLSDGAQPTTTDQLANDPRSISYEELGAALIESENVTNIRILGMSCLSYDFMMNLNAYLAEHLPEARKNERPIMISAANRNSLSSGGGFYLDARFLSAVRERHQQGQPLRLQDFMDAESRLMMTEDPAIFVPDANSPQGVIELAKLFEREEGERRAA